MERSLLTLAVLAAQFRGDGREVSAPAADFLVCAAAGLRAGLESPETPQ
jgi:hypothetical protein